MSILTTATDRHLYSVSSNFTASTSPFSISVWINAVWNGGTTISMVGMYDGTTVITPTTGLQIGITAATVGAVACWTYGGGIMVQSSANAMTTYNNTWVNVTYTYDGTTHLIYANGVQLGTGTASQLPGTFTQVYINGYPPAGNANECAVFGVDMYTYFSRTLSANEVLTIYNAAGQRHGIVNGQLAKYEFDELGQGVTVVNVADLTGNGNTLSVIGAGSAITYSYTNSYADSNIRSPQ